MKYNININQEKIISLGLEIDLIDAALLDFIADMHKWQDSTKIVYHGHHYYWISYGYISDKMPLLKLKKDSIYNRIKKLEDLELISTHPDCKKLRKTYIRMTKLAASIYVSAATSDINPTISEKPTYTDLNPRQHRIKIRRSSDINPKDYNTIDYITNSNKEKIKKEKFDILFLEKLKKDFVFYLEDAKYTLKPYSELLKHSSSELFQLANQFQNIPDYMNSLKIIANQVYEKELQQEEV